MTETTKDAEASLLFCQQIDPLTLVDETALSATLSRIGYPVRDARVLHGEFLLLTCDTVLILVAGLDRPFAMDHFRGVSRRDSDRCRQAEVLAMLAEHRTSLTVIVMNRTETAQPVEEHLREKICVEIVDLLLSITAPDLVFWSGRDELMTAAEAEMDADAGQIRPAAVVLRTHAATTPRPRPIHLPARPGTIDLAALDPLDMHRDVRPTRPEPTMSRTERPTHFDFAPKLSPDVQEWFEGPAAMPAELADPDVLQGLRAFLALDQSTEPRRVAETASGRASIYLMSATIGVFALPIGAAMLTYNALSGGSFRATSHVMALTGVFSALAAAGITNPAAALGLGF